MPQSNPSNEETGESLSLKVIREDRRVETILVNPKSFFSIGKTLYAIESNDMTHYFNKLGYYDGWEMKLDDPKMSMDEAKKLIAETEKHRMIE